mmetsp:Transcript_123806/g.358104  ORF Transcript_123806/g.358104 Transcript_123806/m.358104 type:complete len:178 (-) Transcript_123806:63-596(-)
MGSALSRLLVRGQLRVLVVGLGGAGKTTLLHRLKLGQVVTTISGGTFGVESVEYRHYSFIVIDIGGPLAVRQIWRHYYPTTGGLIWVVDSGDRARVQEVHGNMRAMLNEEGLRGVPLLVFCNKQDLPDAMTADEVCGALALHDIDGRRWMVQSACATTGSGLEEGLHWLTCAASARQ